MFARRWYYIVVVPIAHAATRHMENPDDMDLDEVSSPRLTERVTPPQCFSCSSTS